MGVSGIRRARYGLLPASMEREYSDGGSDDRVDPHKASHAAVAISAAEEPLGELRVRACVAQAERLLAWAAAWPQRTWAVAGHCRPGPPPSSAHLRLNMVRELPRWHRHPDMQSRTVINTQDSRLCPAPLPAEYLHLFEGGRRRPIKHRSARSGRPQRYPLPAESCGTAAVFSRGDHGTRPPR
jgi:hypothetical protein